MLINQHAHTWNAHQLTRFHTLAHRQVLTENWHTQETHRLTHFHTHANTQMLTNQLAHTGSAHQFTSSITSLYTQRTHTHGLHTYSPVHPSLCTPTEQALAHTGSHTCRHRDAHTHTGSHTLAAAGVPTHDRGQLPTHLGPRRCSPSRGGTASGRQRCQAEDRARSGAPRHGHPRSSTGPWWPPHRRSTEPGTRPAAPRRSRGPAGCLRRAEVGEMVGGGTCHTGPPPPWHPVALRVYTRAPRRL